MIDPRTHVQACEDRDRQFVENAKLRADLEQMTKHAKEGWDLAATRASQWKAAELQKEEVVKEARFRIELADLWISQLREALGKAMDALACYPDHDVALQAELEMVRRAVAVKRVHAKLLCGCPGPDPTCHLTTCCERTKGLDH